MSNLAYATPRRRPVDASVEEIAGDDHPLHIQIVTTRAQRRARPKIVYALVAITVMFGIFLAQLLLTIALSSGAYNITSLQSKQVEYGRVASTLSEKLDTVGSTQNLAANATALGMVPSTSQAFLRLSDGKVLGHPTAAGGRAGAAKSGADSSVPNSLLTGLPLAKGTVSGHGDPNTGKTASGNSQSKAGTTKTDSSSGTHSSSAHSSGGSTSSTPTDPGDLPSPQTH
jgi:hypothetical protein